MQGEYSNEPLLDIFIFETSQNIEQLENCILSSEKLGYYSEDTINEIFRIMHTIKGSAAMMFFNDISVLAHSMEDLFFFLREQKVQNIDYSALSDLVLEGVDHIKIELEKIKNGDKTDGDASSLIENNKQFLNSLKEQNSTDCKPEKPAAKEQRTSGISADSAENTGDTNNTTGISKVNNDKISDTSNCNSFKATIFFEDGCEMENIRAYTIIHNLEGHAEEFQYYPKDIIENDDSVQVIRNEGFTIFLKSTKSYDDLNEFFNSTVFLKSLDFIKLDNNESFNDVKEPEKTASEKIADKKPVIDLYKSDEASEHAGINEPAVSNEHKESNEHKDPAEHKEKVETETQHSTAQSIISVNVNKLDKLMDLVGELVIAEAMVVENPDLKGLNLENFNKVARQLHKITSEMQDMVMSIRMVPLSTTFHKMNRIVRDMSKKLNKEVELQLIGEETEVDKNIIEHISDPLMHLVRNSIDHGIENSEDRLAKGKPKAGVITLEAQNIGSDVIITVKDDGKGLDKVKILDKAAKNGLLNKSAEEMIDKDIYNLIFLPGFSTKDSVSEFSGRGVGMDVVVKNIQTVGGIVSVDSTEGTGSTITIKIPLTLAIIDGMNIAVGNSRYTIPTATIKESFRPKVSDIIQDPDGHEMIMVRGQCYPILRIHSYYKVNTNITDFNDGIIIMVEQDNKTLCLFADELLGQQQVVVKALPNYIKKTKKIVGLTGCTLLGDGSISLILDVAGLINTQDKDKL